MSVESGRLRAVGQAVYLRRCVDGVMPPMHPEATPAVIGPTYTQEEKNLDGSGTTPDGSRGTPEVQSATTPCAKIHIKPRIWCDVKKTSV